jgi:hypothetical protein
MSSVRDERLRLETQGCGLKLQERKRERQFNAISGQLALERE